MADLPISGLPSAGALAGTEPLPIVQGGATKKTTVQDVANLVANELTADELAAINGANSPDATNVFLTEDDEVYVKDANDNVFYKGVTATLGTGCTYNIFNQFVGGITFGNNCFSNILESGVSSFTFGNNLARTTIKSGVVGANYTASPNYDFLYGNDYTSEIFRNAENTANYHRYYDPTNDRIVLTNLTTLVVSDIGGGGGGGDAYLANDQTFTGENTFAIGSGTKEPIIVTKGGNGAGIKVTKTSGSGDAIEVAQGSLSIADETASRIAIFDANKRVKSGNTSTYPSLTEIEHVKGVTSAIQTQLNSKTDTITSFVLIGTWASPADGATTYVPIWGNIGTPLGTITTLLTSLNYASRVVGIFVQHFNNSGTQGSNENFAIRLRNNTTSTSTQLINIQTNQASTVIKNFSAFGLTVDSAANDELAIEFLAPTWSTNPTQLQLRIVLFIQKL
jgi:hypothetical protein